MTESRGINIKAFKDFFRSEQIGGFILLGCVIISLIIANSSFEKVFHSVLSEQIGFESSAVQLKYSVEQWINDGLMAIFFLLVGLEIKREILEGELSSPKKAAMPIFAALGGMLVPAIVYSLFNLKTETGHGWGIPMATDIAFALAIISLLGNRVPGSLKVFLAALAIADDLGAILVIAIFYTKELHTNYLFYSAGILLILALLNYFKVKNLLLYLIPGLFLWYFVHHSGIHATIAGVLLALFIPTNPVKEISPLEKLEHIISNPVNFFIMPLFALANTNIPFESGMIEGLSSNLGLGIILGLFLGKPIGVTLFSWLSVKLRLSSLPSQAGWLHIIGLGMLAGIGFTMSIFISLLSFTDATHQTEAKFAILTASILSGISGYIFLNLLNKRRQEKELK
ncbi:Na+/H+ antiporter NhaA [Rubrolithibacter danxiaensis]|uniref:Na+/H+ antiporter NhaA n=1 Tax=Rubrolithibacter danxiaensis TaxID=3390805 RepID=UPI003BF7F91C